jgi:hypothetical protein
MLNDDGVRRLAIAVLQQAVTDSCKARHLSTVAVLRAFMARREDFDEFWCALVGLQGDSVRERLEPSGSRRHGERSGIDLLSGVSVFSRRISRAVEHGLDDGIRRTQLVQGSSRVGRGHRF